jgi:hypothetical protein
MVGDMRVDNEQWLVQQHYFASRVGAPLASPSAYLDSMLTGCSWEYAKTSTDGVHTVRYLLTVKATDIVTQVCPEDPNLWLCLCGTRNDHSVIDCKECAYRRTARQFVAYVTCSTTSTMEPQLLNSCIISGVQNKNTFVQEFYRVKMREGFALLNTLPPAAQNILSAESLAHQEEVSAIIMSQQRLQQQLQQHQQQNQAHNYHPQATMMDLTESNYAGDPYSRVVYQNTQERKHAQSARAQPHTVQGAVNNSVYGQPNYSNQYHQEQVAAAKKQQMLLQQQQLASQTEAMEATSLASQHATPNSAAEAEAIMTRLAQQQGMTPQQLHQLLSHDSLSLSQLQSLLGYS